MISVLNGLTGGDGGSFSTEAAEVASWRSRTDAPSRLKHEEA